MRILKYTLIGLFLGICCFTLFARSLSDDVKTILYIIIVIIGFALLVKRLFFHVPEPPKEEYTQEDFLKDPRKNYKAILGLTYILTPIFLIILYATQESLSQTSIIIIASVLGVISLLFVFDIFWRSKRK